MKRINYTFFLFIAAIVCVILFILARDDTSVLNRWTRSLYESLEGFANAPSETSACPPGYTFFNNEAGESFCCRGQVNPYTHKCEVKEEAVVVYLERAPKPLPRGPDRRAGDPTLILRIISAKYNVFYGPDASKSIGISTYSDNKTAGYTLHVPRSIIDPQEFNDAMSSYKNKKYLLTLTYQLENTAYIDMKITNLTADEKFLFIGVTISMTEMDNFRRYVIGDTKKWGQDISIKINRTPMKPGGTTLWEGSNGMQIDINQPSLDKTSIMMVKTFANNDTGIQSLLKAYKSKKKLSMTLNMPERNWKQTFDIEMVRLDRDVVLGIILVGIPTQVPREDDALGFSVQSVVVKPYTRNYEANGDNDICAFKPNIPDPRSPAEPIPVIVYVDNPPKTAPPQPPAPPPTTFIRNSPKMVTEDVSTGIKFFTDDGFQSGTLLISDKYLDNPGDMRNIIDNLYGKENLGLVVTDSWGNERKEVLPIGQIWLGNFYGMKFNSWPGGFLPYANIDKLGFVIQNIPKRPSRPDGIVINFHANQIYINIPKSFIDNTNGFKKVLKLDYKEMPLSITVNVKARRWTQTFPVEEIINGDTQYAIKTTGTLTYRPMPDDAVGFTIQSVPVQRGEILPLCGSLIKNTHKQNQSMCPPTLPNYAMIGKCCQHNPDGNGFDCIQSDNADTNKYCKVVGPLKPGEHLCAEMTMLNKAECPKQIPNKTTYTTGQKEAAVYGADTAGLAVPVCFGMNDVCIPDSAISYYQNANGLYKGKDIQNWSYSCSGWENQNVKLKDTSKMDRSYL
jgi:hypothetical protein